MNISPRKLQKGDEIRVIAPARSLKIISQQNIEYAVKTLQGLGFKVSFSKNCNAINEFNSSSIEQRVNDLHDAFLDKNVKCILTVIGGFNSNQILDYINFDIIKENPKIICGFSDITILLNAINEKTNLITYYGPHFSTFAVMKRNEYTIKYFQNMVCQNNNYNIEPAPFYSDDLWFLDQENRIFEQNKGYSIINPINFEGELVGGNLNTFNLLQGTKYFPNLKNKVLIIEDTSEQNMHNFDRDLQSIIQQKNFDQVKGILIGRFQNNSKISLSQIKTIIKSKKELNNIGVIANIDFGHTLPLVTLPIGGKVKVVFANKKCKITIENT